MASYYSEALQAVNDTCSQVMSQGKPLEENSKRRL